MQLSHTFPTTRTPPAGTSMIGAKRQSVRQLHFISGQQPAAPTQHFGIIRLAVWRRPEKQRAPHPRWPQARHMQRRREPPAQ